MSLSSPTETYLYPPEGCRPRALQSIILKAIFCTGKEHEAALSELLKHLDDGTVLAQERVRRLLPMLLLRLRREKRARLLPRQVRDYCMRAWATSEHNLRCAVRVSELLREHGIASVLLKGTAMLTHYGIEDYWRDMSDVDLLILKKDVECAIGLLRSLGFRREGQAALTALETKMQFEHSVVLRAPNLPELDLHWHASALVPQKALDCELWARTEEVVAFGTRVTRLERSAQLFHTLLHWVADSWDENPNAHGVGDSLVLLNSHPELIDWHWVTETALQYETTLLLMPALNYLSDTFNAPIPKSALTRLSRANVSIWERWERMARYQPGSERMLGYVPNLICHYRRSFENMAGSLPVSFSRYLTYRWKLASPVVLPLIIAEKAFRRLRSGAWRGDAEP